jgi:HEAT repeat protein
MGLGAIKDQRAIDELLPRLKDEAPDVRASVATALGSLKAKQAVEQLMSLLRDESRMVKTSAALALSDIGDKRAVAALREAVANEKDEETQTHLKEALQRLLAAPDQ